MIGLAIGLALCALGVGIGFFGILRRRAVFTPQPLQYLNDTGHCPDCNCAHFYDGPCGGAAVNIMCANPSCRSRFWFCPPFSPTRAYNDPGFYRLNHPPQTLEAWGHIELPKVLKFGRRK